MTKPCGIWSAADRMLSTPNAKSASNWGGFLLRHGFRYSGKCAWTSAHRRWLAGIKMPHPAQQIMLQEYIHSRNHVVTAIARELSGFMWAIAKHLPVSQELN